MKGVGRISDRQLLALHAAVMNELRSRQIVRTSNSPAADYAEQLVAQALKLKLNVSSTAGYDGTDRLGKKYEVKCRRITPHNSSRQLSAIRGMERRKFDFLVGVLFDSDFSVRRAALIPYRLVKKHSTFVKNTNSWKFFLRDSVWTLPGVKELTRQLRKVQKWD